MNERRDCIHIIGFSLALCGLFGEFVCCVMPMWRVYAFIGSNIVTSQGFGEGLWMTCVKQSTGQMQCKAYDSMLALPRDLQAARAMVVIAILLAVMGVLLDCGIGGRRPNCFPGQQARRRASIACGVCFILSGLLCLIPVSWSANEVIRNFYSPVVSDPQKWELGLSLFIGWAGSAVLLIGGALHLCKCDDPMDGGYSAKYSAPRSTGNGEYV